MMFYPTGDLWLLKSFKDGKVDGVIRGDLEHLVEMNFDMFLHFSVNMGSLSCKKEKRHKPARRLKVKPPKIIPHNKTYNRKKQKKIDQNE